MPINDSVNADMNHSAKEQEVQQYFCPVKDCPRAVDGGKPFPRLGQLKQVQRRIETFKIMFLLLQHFDGVHAEKSFVCNKCGKKFGLKDVCSRHEKECGKTIVCETCGASFKSKNSYTKHLKRKRHLSTTARFVIATLSTIVNLDLMVSDLQHVQLLLAHRLCHHIKYLLFCYHQQQVQ